MKTIEIALDKTLLPIKEKEITQSYVDVLNGLSFHCQNDGWKQGFRNEIAVNLTVSAYLLGLDAVDILNEFIKAGIIDPSTDDQWTEGRVETVLSYDRSFDWNWMIDAPFWQSLGKDYGKGDDLKLYFKLS